VGVMMVMFFNVVLKSFVVVVVMGDTVLRVLVCCP
jgi:hypothetical protein